MDDLQSLSLKELFDLSNEIGDKYLTDDEMNERDRRMDSLRQEMLANFALYAESTREQRQGDDA